MTNSGELQKHISWIQHLDLREFISSGKIPSPWFPAYKKIETKRQSTIWFSAMVPSSLIPQLIKNNSGDISIGDGRPSVWTHYEKRDVSKRVYCSFGNEEGIEPLVIYRNFHGIREPFFEVAQEFRLFHNLFHDTSHNRYFHFDDYGDETEAVRYEDNSVEIRVDLLLNFCAMKQMTLAFYVDSFRHSSQTLKQLGLKEIHLPFSDSTNSYYVSLVQEPNLLRTEFKTFSRLLGKKYFLPGPMPPERDEKDETYQEFIINTDAVGKPIKSTCNPEELDNYFGKNSGAPHYLTPIFFRGEVLSKYYADPAKYSVSDGILRCGGLWSLQIDNDHSDYVVVYLGDLGKYLSEKERNYWLSFNIPPDGRKISQTNFRRSFLAEFVDPKRPDLMFKHEYVRFQRDFREAHGWDFFKPLHADDHHFFTGLRLPLKDSQSEFDAQLLALTKIIVDSINEEEIANGLKTVSKDDKGITKLEKFFSEHGFMTADYTHLVKFLRVLQDLRSKSVAHRKGSNYEKLVEDLQLADKGQQRVFGALLSAAIDFLAYLRTNFIPVRKTP